MIFGIWAIYSALSVFLVLALNAIDEKLSGSDPIRFVMLFLVLSWVGASIGAVVYGFMSLGA